MKVLKTFLIFALGAASGSAGCYVYFTRKARKVKEKYENDLAEMDKYYLERCANCGVDAEVEDVETEEIPKNTTSKPEPRGGSFKTPYNDLFKLRHVDPAYEEHPEEDEQVEVVKQAPIKIKPRYYGSEGYSTKVLYYYTVDDALIPEGASYQDILDTDEVKDAVGNVIDKYHFSDEGNTENEMFIRNFSTKCDYRIIKRIGSLSDDYDGDPDYEQG